jgi:hypothetical protein
LRRIHLFEIQDQPWCPRSLRDAITDSIQFGLVLFNFYGPIFTCLRQAVLASKSRRILDLNSGGGGPWPKLWRVFEKSDLPIEISLSDKYPNLASFKRISIDSGGQVSFHQEPIDTLILPPNLNGFRTIFSAFHHFRPQEARGILQNAVDSGQGIGLFEMTSRHPLSFLLVVGMPFFTLLYSPFIRPFRLSRLFWTYIIPAAPIVGFLDGIVSCLRTYSCDELRELTESLSTNDYNWAIEKETTPIIGAPITFLIGYPKSISRK